ncbi:MAG TPA: ABC transporter substrate-binding protein [Rhodopila sp.]|nr:ABC transporter substrate-binding protein [Rhodopila sp.]
MRRTVALAAAVMLGMSGAHPDAADNKYGPGVSDTEIKLGQTMPYSGPMSALGASGRAQLAYYRMIDDEGGINGRKVTLISLDDGYSPPKTVEQTRKLVEQDGVFAIVNSVGTPTNTAIYKYLNQRHVPQLFIGSGASKWRDYSNSPWTISGTLNYVIEGHIYARYILRTRPDAKIAVLYQNDDFGKDYLKGLEEGLGDHVKMIVASASYEPTDPGIDSQVVSLKESGADTLVDFTLTKFTSLTIRKVYDLGWKPQHFIPSVSNGIGAVLTPAGIERSTGLYSALVLKSFSDPQWTNDPGMKNWLAFMRKYLPDADVNDTGYEAGYTAAQLSAQALRQCGNDLTRENLMRQATGLNNFHPDLMLPGITVTTSPTNYDTIHTARLSRFDGKSWVLMGDLISE